MAFRDFWFRDVGFWDVGFTDLGFRHLGICGLFGFEGWSEGLRDVGFFGAHG